jgi:hypothetical protein
MVFICKTNVIAAGSYNKILTYCFAQICRVLLHFYVNQLIKMWMHRINLLQARKRQDHRENKAKRRIRRIEISEKDGRCF